MNQKKFHSKKYQSDVKWLVPSLAAVTLGLSLSGAPTTVKADSTPAANAKTPAGTAAPKNSQVASGQTSTASDQAGDSTANATSTAVTAGSKPSTPAAQTDPTQTASAPTATQTVNMSALKADPAISSTAIAASKAAVPVAITNYDSANTSTPDASAPKSIVIGGGSDLTKWFNGEGNVSRNDASSVTIGSDYAEQASVGGVRLNQTINLSTDDFDLVGYIVSGNTSSNSVINDGGGMGFIFYPKDNTKILGSNWKDIGIGGIPNVIGWKYDRISDTISDPNDSTKTITTPAIYGAFTTTDGSGKEAVDSDSVKSLNSIYKSTTRIEFKYDHLTHTIEVNLPDQNKVFKKQITVDSDNSVYNFAIISGNNGYRPLGMPGGEGDGSVFSFTIDTAGGTVNYVDDNTLDTNGNPITVATDSLSGATGTTITYSKTSLPDGYILDPDKLTDMTNKGFSFTTNADGSTSLSLSGVNYAAGDPNDPNDPNNFTVHLKHHTTQSSVTKNVTESIHYVMPAGVTAPSDPASQTASFSATETYDAVTKNFSYSGWTGKGLNQVTPPPITGYTPSISYTLNGGNPHTLAGTTIPATLPDDLVTNDPGDLSLDYAVTYVPTKETATIDFMDETDSTNKLKSMSFSGDYGTSVASSDIQNAIKTYTDQGYVVDPSKSDNTQNVSFNDSPTIKIYLTHGQTTISPDNPTIKYPDGSNITPPTPTDSNGQEISPDSLTKTVKNVAVQPTDKNNDTIPSTTKDVTFNHTIIVDNVTGKTIEDKGWSADPSSLPHVDGYTPNTDSDKMPTYPTVDDLPNENGTIEVPYSPEVTINYVDDDATDSSNNSLGTSDTPVPGDKGDPIDKVQAVNDKIAKLEKEGYVLAAPLGNFDGSSTVTIHLKHGTTIVDPKHPQTAGTPISDPDGPKWPESVGDVTKTVTVIVQAKDKAGNPMPGSETPVPVKFDHTIVVDNVTGNVKNESWTPDSSSLPPFSGYITDSSTLPTLPKDGDTIEVTYEPIIGPVSPTTPSNPDQDNNDPNKNNNGNSDNGGKNGNGSANGGKNSNGSANGGKNSNGSTNGGKNSNGSANGGKNSNGSANGGKNSNGSANGGKSSNGSANGGKSSNGSANSGKNGNGSADGSQNGNNSAKNGSSSANSGSRLPQTGSSMMSQFIGIIMTLIAGVVGWFGFKKHDDKETK